MKASDITYTIIIIIIFIVLLFFNILVVGIKNVKENWPQYRCNPMVMPFASIFGKDTSENFTYCIQTMQSNYMSTLMQPLDYNFSVISELGSSLTNSINDVRAFFDKFRNMITSLIQNIFGIFLNIIIEFQKLMINIKDLFGKFIGILAALIYTLDGSIITMESVWKGPPGKAVRAIGKAGDKINKIGKKASKKLSKLCFHPETKIQTLDGKFIAMKDIKLGAVLKNKARVISVMRIDNLDENNNHIEKFYKVEGGENNKPIYVTGSHLIYDPILKNYVKVENLRGIKPSILTDITSNELSCLITSNHSIPIGEWLFHDWEDNSNSSIKPHV
tara:strand:- start:1213 stop:2208 length:996 start_codon:yes stop_codon:yes gene_type:complete